MHGVRLGGLVFVIGVVLGGCAALDKEVVIAPTATRTALESYLGVSLRETPAVNSVATLTDVAAIYTLRTTGERLHVIVFDTRDATVQLTGDAIHAEGGLLIVANVVAIYEHHRGTSRLPQLRTALRSLRSSST